MLMGRVGGLDMWIVAAIAIQYKKLAFTYLLPVQDELVNRTGHESSSNEIGREERTPYGYQLLFS